MDDFTVEQLVNAIRKASTLDDLHALQKLVGAGQPDHDAAVKRINEIDHIYDSHGGRISEMSVMTQERYKMLNDEQAAFEAKYG